MIPGSYSLIDGSLIEMLRFENVANNLANINTNGFKKDVISFNQVLKMANYSKIDLSPGPVRYTGNPLDLALNDGGFFKIQTSKGIRYTRDGAFTLNNDQVLVNQRGDTVMGENGPIQINGKNVLIARDGGVMADGAVVDKISVVEFNHPQLLRKAGNSYFTYEVEGQGATPAKDVDVRQGYIEASNVDPTKEMIKMIETMRNFESAQKAIQILDEISRKIINDPGLI